MKRLFAALYVLLLAIPVLAQSKAADAPRPGEGEINRQPEFFDPTRKVKAVKEDYHFSVDYRVEVGYAQNQQRSESQMNPFLHGVKLGATFDFNLPLHFSIQTGAAFCVTYGRIEQHFRSLTAESVQTEYLRHGVNQYYLEVPVRAYYTQKLWRELNLFFYTGPVVDLGLAQLDFVHDHLSDYARTWCEHEGVRTLNHDRYQPYLYTNSKGEEVLSDRELRRCNIRYGLGGGLEWAQYRVVAGYDFGLNNLVYNKAVSDAKMNEWGWYVSFAYRLNKK